jgi:hypothetical protein
LGNLSFTFNITRITKNNLFGLGTTVPTSMLHLAGSLALPYGAVTTATYAVSDPDTILRVSVACTVTLPSASVFLNRILVICNVGAVAIISNASNVYPIGSTVLGTAILAATSGKFALLQSNGANWVTIMAN